MARNHKEVIVEKAFELFLNKGYEATSLQAIITAANSSKGAVYHHFPSKYHIYLAVLDSYFFSLFERIQLKDVALSFEKRIQQRYFFFVELLHFIELTGSGVSFPIRKYFLFQLSSERDAAIRERIQATLGEYHHEVLTIVTQAREAGVLHTGISTSAVAQQLISMIEGLVIHHSTVERGVKVLLSEKYEEVIAPYLQLLTNRSNHE